MKPNDYVKKILARQTFDDDARELKELQRRGKELEKLLRNHFSESSPKIRWGGSMAKRTMIRDSYDGDMICYFPHGDTTAGANLQEIYENTERALGRDYVVERKASALRVKDPSTTSIKGFAEDLHIDVVPGRFTDDAEQDVFLHRTTGEKERLRTNLDMHIAHIRDSGVVDAIRLMKLWKDRNGLRNAKTFVLELLVVKFLRNRRSADLCTQLEHVWAELRDSPDGLAVEDPANPSGNDLKPIVDECRSELSTAARNTLWQIDERGWEAVFGPVDDDEVEGKGEDGRASLGAAAAQVLNPTKPWLCR
ncbi:MAG: hypothetical protein A49_23830 [Methyloceanibacter sp.]|nr:MAG: hypothetical protein A49_23830 [Methyloceanibacter sp.]